MKRRVILSFSLGLLLAVGLLWAPIASAGSGSFTGAWTALDEPGDGSIQVLTIGTGPRPGVVYQDLFASVCASAGSASTHFRAVGAGELDGDVLVVEFPHGGGCGAFRLDPGVFEFTYDPETDTLFDGMFTWTRVGS
jgi:hypothetical protein